MKINTCPICESENTLEQIKVPYNVKIGEGDSSQEIITYRCSNCGFEGDLDSDNEKIIKKTVSLARQDCVSKILDDFDKDFQFTDIERAFSLPPRTLSKWKNKSKAPSASATALIRLLNVFPWLIYVGMSNFDVKLAHRIAGKAITKRMLCDSSINCYYLETDSHKVLSVVSSTKSINDLPNKLDHISSPYKG